MDEGNADNTGMPRVHAPDCQVGFLHTHRIKGSHAVEGRKAMLLTCDSRCSQVPWIDAGCSALDWSTHFQFVKQYWYIGLHSLLFKRSMLSCLISKDLKQNAKKKKKMVLNFTPEHSQWDWSCKHLQCHSPQACFSCRNVALSCLPQCIVCILFYWGWGRILAI